MSRVVFRTGYAVAALAVVVGAIAYATRVEGTEPSARVRDPAVPSLGVNFVRFAALPGTDRAAPPGARRDRPLEPDEVAADFRILGVGAMRQLTSGDVGWRGIEAEDGAWEFRNADRALQDPAAEPILTLFDMQYASPNPPWAGPDDPFPKTLGPEARDYVTAVVTRYRDRVRYWEIGNEMDHWRAADPGPKAKVPHRSPPRNTPPEGFTPEEQGRFVAEVAALVRELDPDAVIVMPGMSSLADYVVGTWLPGFVEGAGADAFDVVNYHHYGPWPKLAADRARLDERLRELGVADKPVWLTETGVTSDPTLTARTRYPNSEEAQAADVIRRAVIGWGAGDQLVLWHAYWDSPAAPQNQWRGYGLHGPDGPKPSWTAFRVLATEIAPWARIERVEAASDQWIWRVEREDGAIRWVAWGEGRWKLPDGAARVLPTVVATGESPEWAKAKRAIDLSEHPVIVGP